jgi:hypothetical protein
LSDGDNPQDPEHRRKSERVAVRAEVHLRKSGYHRASVDLIDLSPEGCRVELPERVGLNETVWVTFPGLQPIEAKVAWVTDWLAGLRFTNPLYPSVFDALVSRIK